MLGTHHACPQVGDDCGVDVKATGIGTAAAGKDLEAVVGAPYHRGVERSGAEIVDESGRTRGDAVTRDSGEVVRRRDRFADKRPR
nr:hypothetical protein [Virgisporangium ochraceum]